MKSLTGADLAAIGHLLPGTARDLIDLVGLPAAQRFIDAYGGRTLDIAKGRRARGEAQLQELAEVVGAVAARHIARRYGGTPLAIPNCKRAITALRDAALQARFDALTAAGHSARRAVAMLVGEFGLVESSIWRALKRPAAAVAVRAAAPDAGQMGLFA